MSKSKAQLREKDVVIRTYKQGDEDQIVSLLNTCFGEWGTLRKWKALYPQYPTFDETDVFIMEKNGEIIGHEALHFRDLIIHGNHALALSTVSLSDAAIHPAYRGQGLHNSLLEIMLQAAKSKGAGFVVSWYLRDSGLHKHSKKLGFVEVKQPSAYMKVIRPEKLLQSGLLDFVHKSPKLKEALGDLSDGLYFRLGESTFSLAELLGKAERGLVENRRKVEIVFSESSLRTLVRFRNMSRRQRLWSLFLLIMFRRARVRFSSLRAFINFTRKGVFLLGSI